MPAIRWEGEGCFITSQQPKINYYLGRSSLQQHAQGLWGGGTGVCLLMSQQPKIENCVCVCVCVCTPDLVGQVSNNVPPTVGVSFIMSQHPKIKYCVGRSSE